MDWKIWDGVLSSLLILGDITEQSEFSSLYAWHKISTVENCRISGMRSDVACFSDEPTREYERGMEVNNIN